MYFYKLDAIDYEGNNDYVLVHDELYTETEFRRFITYAAVIAVEEALGANRYIHDFSGISDRVVYLLCEIHGFRFPDYTVMVSVFGNASLFTYDPDNEFGDLDETLLDIRRKLGARGYTWLHDSYLNFDGKHR